MMWRISNSVVWWVKAVFHIGMGIILLLPFMIAMYVISKDNDL